MQIFFCVEVTQLPCQYNEKSYEGIACDTTQASSAALADTPHQNELTRHISS